MKLLDFCKETIVLLDSCSSAEFPSLYVSRRSEVFRRFHGGLIISTAHGIDYFKNVVNYIEKPDEYKETIRGNSEYEENFREILRRNQINENNQ